MLADYITLAEILTQIPLQYTNWKLSRKLSEEELVFLTLSAKNHFDKIMAVLRSISNKMVLVIRYVQIFEY